MRPGQNKRMRGRNNNRKGPNPLTRSYESNGPDVKIRGTAHHVAEKYLQLARDAQSSGDPVMAESYLQHAEHYFRLIAAAQLAQQQAQVGYVRAPGEAESDDSDDDDDVGGLPDRFASPAERFPQQQPFTPQSPPASQPQPQPYGDRAPYNGDRNHQQQDRPYQERQPRQERNFPDRNDRNQRGDRPYQDRNEQNRFAQNRGPRDNRPPRDTRNEAPREQPAAAVAEIEPNALPSFITSPVRVAPTEPVSAAPFVPVAEPVSEQDDAGGFHLRSRRRRRPRVDAGENASGAEAADAGSNEITAGK
jgi:hypothetical protein